MIPIDDILREKTLWQIYRKSRVITDSKFNGISALLVIALLSAGIVAANPTTSETLTRMRSLANLGLTSSLGVLGFLIAGFTLFATVCRPKLLVRMATSEHPETGLSWFKYNFFAFMRVFIYYLVFASACLFLILFGEPRSGAGALLNLSPDPSFTKLVVARAAMVMLGGGAYFVLFQLKSFVFNVYHVVATWIRWEAENPSDKGP